MKKFNRYILSSILCTCLTACNSGGSSNNNSNNIAARSTDENIIGRGELVWYVTIQNDSDYTYVIQTTPGSSRINGEDTWNEYTELDQRPTIPPHTVKVIRSASYRTGSSRSFNLLTSDGTIKNQVITLHKGQENDNDNLYITNDTYKTSGKAIFNHDPKPLPLNSADVLGGVYLINTFNFHPENLLNHINFALHRDNSQAIIDELKSQTNSIEESIAQERADRMQSGKGLHFDAGLKLMSLKYDIVYNVFKSYAADYNKRFGLNLSDAEIKDLSKYLMLVHNANMNTVKFNSYIQNLNNKMTIQSTDLTSIPSAKSSLQRLQVLDREISESIEFVVNDGYILPSSTERLGMTTGLFGIGAPIYRPWSYTAEDTDGVLTSIQIDNSGVAKVNSFNNATVDKYLASCDNLGSESDTIIAVCRDNNNNPQISTLNLKLNLREKENIVNNNGHIQGGDQYHEYCSYSYNDNGVIYALCDRDDKLLKLDYSHDCADNAEIQYDDGSLICSKLRNYSYSNSCSNVDLPNQAKGIIAALCIDDKGIPHDKLTVLNSTLCASGSDIINRNANLTCAKYKSSIPSGSYLDNCIIGYYGDNIEADNYGIVGATCSDKNGVMGFQQLKYLEECAYNSTISISPNGHLRCDKYRYYLTATDIANLRATGKNAELERLRDLGKIQ